MKFFGHTSEKFLCKASKIVDHPMLHRRADEFASYLALLKSPTFLMFYSPPWHSAARILLTNA